MLFDKINLKFILNHHQQRQAMISMWENVRPLSKVLLMQCEKLSFNLDANRDV